MERGKSPEIRAGRQRVKFGQLDLQPTIEEDSDVIGSRRKE
jgi:hypothetical protein